MSKKTLSFSFFFFFIFSIVAQNSNIGNLPIRNYSKKVYEGGTQNWDIGKDEKGILYFANNEGLLEFDGNYWRKYPISNKTIVRSLAIDKEKIYVGAQGELGYFEADKTNKLVYYSLVDALPKDHKEFADVWRVVLHKDAVFFHTERLVFQWKNEIMKVYNTGGPIHYLGVINDEIYVHDEYKGLLKFTGDSFLLQKFSEKPASPVIEFLPYNKDTVLIVTRNDGIYFFDQKDLTKWDIPNNDFFIGKSINAAIDLSSGSYALGVNSIGVVLIDKNGRIFNILGRNEGLQNINFHCLKTDLAGNLWLGLDNGIDYIEATSSFSYLYPDGNIEGTGYSAVVKDELLYLANSNGLFVTPLKNENSDFTGMKFEKMRGTSGLVYGLHLSENELFMGHHEGAFHIGNSSAEKLPNLFGVWNYLRLDANHLLAGHYSGMAIYKKENNNWRYYKEIEGLNESSRILALDKNNVVWMAHPYRGIYRVELNKDYSTKKVKRYGTENRLPSDLFNHVFNIRGEIVFAGETNVFSFEEETENFIPIESYNQVFNKYGRVKMLKDGLGGNVWFLAGEVCGRLLIEDSGLDKKVEVQKFPELRDKLVGGFEFVYPYDKNNIFFGSEKGFIHFDPEKYTFQDTSFQIRIQEITLLSSLDSIIYSGSGIVDLEDTPSFFSHQNSLKFNFSANYYRNPEEVLYQTKLKGLNDYWSDWSPKVDKEYSNLTYGSYEFSVRAMNAKGIITNESHYKFEISPPWYFTKLAFFVYGVFLIGWIYELIRRQQAKFKKEKLALKNELVEKEKIYQEKVEKGELEISKMKQTQLETEVEFKNKELASTTLHLVQKREMMTGLKNELVKLSIKAKSTKVEAKDINKLIRLLDYDSNNDEEWERFAHHFDSVHQNFLQRVKEAYPQLSPNDLKLCAYLKMNLSTKEIAPLMHISVRGVEASRYRLRKKMKLDSDTNLREVMMTF